MKGRRLDLAAALERALELARKGEGHTRPNPPVGAVLVARGAIVGEGFHRRAGAAHAEVAAIADARRRHPRLFLRSAPPLTLVVTLEPCSKPGRVGACTDAIVAAGIRQVYYAVSDPNPANRGRARRILARAGVGCTRLSAGSKASGAGVGADELLRLDGLVREAEFLIEPFAKFVASGRPFVTVKLAMSLDGKICDDSGRARWISSAASRRLTGRARERVDAIMVGAETVRRDDPSLLSHGRRNDDLIRVVVSRSGRLPKTARVFADGRNATLVFGSPEEALSALGRLGCLHVLCEGGLSLARSLADRGFVDRWLLVTAPLVIGSRPLSEALWFSAADGIRLYRKPFRRAK